MPYTFLWWLRWLIIMFDCCECVRYWSCASLVCLLLCFVTTLFCVNKDVYNGFACTFAIIKLIRSGFNLTRLFCGGHPFCCFPIINSPVDQWLALFQLAAAAKYQRRTYSVLEKLANYLCDVYRRCCTQNAEERYRFCEVAYHLGGAITHEDWTVGRHCLCRFWLQKRSKFKNFAQFTSWFLTKMFYTKFLGLSLPGPCLSPSLAMHEIHVINPQSSRRCVHTWPI